MADDAIRAVNGYTIDPRALMWSVVNRAQRKQLERRSRGRSFDVGTEFLLLLEFQGRPDPEMALRTADYTILAIRELRRRDKALARGHRRLTAVCLVWPRKHSSTATRPTTS